MAAYRGDKSKKSVIGDSFAVTLKMVAATVTHLIRVTVTVTEIKIRRLLIQLNTLRLVMQILKSGWKYEEMYENPGVLTVYFTRREN